MTSATDEMRRLLDERGVEWDTFSVGNTEYTHWTNSDGHWCAASIGGPLSLHVNILSATPEQAVEATLGRGTCHVECFDDGMDEGLDGEWFAYTHPTWHLSCGHEVYGSERPHYCSTCGKRVVE